MMTSLQSAVYVYDGDGSLVKSIINNVVTYYVGRHYHKTVNGANVSIKKFYAIGMSQIAVRTDGVLQWILTDHLSSASVSASVDGTLVSEVKYREAPRHWHCVRGVRFSARTCRPAANPLPSLTPKVGINLLLMLHKSVGTLAPQSSDLRVLSRGFNRRFKCDAFRWRLFNYGEPLFSSSTSPFHKRCISSLVSSSSSSVPSAATIPSLSTMMRSARRRAGRRCDTTRQVKPSSDW
jgi:hypothetical protein